MPLYEYQCEACENRFERIQKFSDPPVTVCPKCGKGPVHKLISSPAIQFKGSGWYITDYARKGESSSKSDSKSDTASDAKSKDAASGTSSSDSSKDTASSTKAAEKPTASKPAKPE